MRRERESKEEDREEKNVEDSVPIEQTSLAISVIRADAILRV